MTTRAPSLGRGCRAQRGGVGFLFLRRSRLLFAFPMGKGFVRRYCFSTYACIRSDNARKAIFSFRKPSPLGKGDRVSGARVLSQAAYLRRSPPLFFIPLEPYPARSARHLPPRGEGFVSGITVFSYRSLPHWGRGTASAVDRVLSYIVDLRRSSSSLFHTASTLSGSLRSPPSPRGEGFVSGIAAFSYRSLPHWGRGTASAVDRVLSFIACLRRSSPLFFIPLVPYPARSARHLPQAGKALCRE